MQLPIHAALLTRLISEERPYKGAPFFERMNHNAN